MANTNYVWTQELALVGPCRYALNATAGLGTTATAAALAFTTREILVGGTSDGNIKVKFADRTTAVTIPVKAGQRYPWAVTHIYSLASGGVSAIWAFK
jgi:hypothetical protein